MTKLIADTAADTFADRVFAKACDDKLIKRELVWLIERGIDDMDYLRIIYSLRAAGLDI
ncbi:MAG: hypothetical protein IJT48_07745 [Bacteroidaceae bacterium]|nr:hypothetical protein [Bacteroidaceae bacterium]